MKSWKTLMYGTQWNPLNLLGEGEKKTTFLSRRMRAREKSSSSQELSRDLWEIKLLKKTKASPKNDSSDSHRHQIPALGL